MSDKFNIGKVPVEAVGGNYNEKDLLKKLKTYLKKYRTKN